VTIYQLAKMIIDAAKSRSEIQFVPWDFADVELRVPDVKKAEQRLGFRARIELDVGLQRTLDWYRRKMGL
jgi:nucleoside-diphosphate-sugar epimerase